MRWPASPETMVRDEKPTAHGCRCKRLCVRGDGTTVWASCRSGFASVCLSCERSYQIDTKKIRRDGFDSLRFDRMLVTFMFDSFGRVHSMARAGHKGHGASRSGARAQGLQPGQGRLDSEPGWIRSITTITGQCAVTITSGKLLDAFRFNLVRCGLMPSSFRCSRVQDASAQVPVHPRDRPPAVRMVARHRLWELQGVLRRRGRTGEGSPLGGRAAALEQGMRLPSDRHELRPSTTSPRLSPTWRRT